MSFHLDVPEMHRSSLPFISLFTLLGPCAVGMANAGGTIGQYYEGRYGLRDSRCTVGRTWRIVPPALMHQFSTVGEIRMPSLSNWGGICRRECRGRRGCSPILYK
jgi:hypothetical protein